MQTCRHPLVWNYKSPFPFSEAEPCLLSMFPEVFSPMSLCLTTETTKTQQRIVVVSFPSTKSYTVDF